jgi:hypothetical protein
MALSRGPKIITDGLVLCLDAADKKSYSGSGTTWYDRSGDNIDGTLINDLAFSTDAGGCLDFDGVDDYVQRAQGFQIGNGRQKTLEVWLKDWGNGAVLSMTEHANNYKWQDHFRALSQFMSGSGYGTVYSFPAGGAETAGWHHWVDVCDEDLTATNRVKRYIDGVLISSSSQATDDGSSFYDGSDLYLDIGMVDLGQGAGASDFFDGKIAVVRIYNFALSQSQARANFNAMRGRFGI